MREIRKSGSEGGGARERSPYPYGSSGNPSRAALHAALQITERERRGRSLYRIPDGRGSAVLGRPGAIPGGRAPQTERARRRDKKEGILMTRITRVLTILPAAPLLLCGGAAEALTPLQKCEADKLKFSGKYSLCPMLAEAKAVRTGNAPDYTVCNQKIATWWAKVEGRPGAMCAVPGDLAPIQGRVTTDANELTQAIGGNTVADCGNAALPQVRSRRRAARCGSQGSPPHRAGERAAGQGAGAARDPRDGRGAEGAAAPGARQPGAAELQVFRARDRSGHRHPTSRARLKPAARRWHAGNRSLTLAAPRSCPIGRAILAAPRGRAVCHPERRRPPHSRNPLSPGFRGA